MALSLITAPTAEPVTLAEAKSHLRVDSADDDTLITALIAAARLHLDGKDGWLGRALVTQTWDLLLDDFQGVIRLPLAPVQSITSVTYLDTAGVLQTLAASKYRTDLVTEPARITEEFGMVWPSTYGVVNAVTIRFVAGYGAPGAVPEAIKLGLKALIAHFYEQREPVLIGGGAVEIQLHLERILMPYRVWSPA